MPLLPPLSPAASHFFPFPRPLLVICAGAGTYKMVGKLIKK